tara:strand:+ start:1347 stop:1793 length:447 start_codon:yes stop_codon:yes gene_type:complete
VINELLKGMVGEDILHKAFALQDAMEALPEEERLTKEDLEPIHYFADGMYLRSLFLPEGLAVVGEVHRHSHFTILAEGKSSIVSQDGEMHVEAPFVFISTPYAKRCVYAETDCTWITVHLNHDNCTEIEELENRHVIKDKKELLEMLK